MYILHGINVCVGQFSNFQGSEIQHSTKVSKETEKKSPSSAVQLKCYGLEAIVGGTS